MWKSFFTFNDIVIALSLLCPMTISYAESLNSSLPKYNDDQRAASVVTLTLEAALLRVQVENPALAEIQARAQAMAAIPSQAGSFPDPIVSFNALNLPVDTFNIDQEPMTQLQLAVSQQLPYPGKLALKEQIATHQAQAANSNIDEMRLLLNRDIKALWWRLFFLDRSLDVIDINTNLLRQFIEIAQTKYKVGQGLQQDVLLAQLELSKLLDRNIKLISSRKQEAARLNALLNQAIETPINLPALNDIDVNLPTLKALTSIFDIAQKNRPALAGKRLLIDAATARLELAERELYPDFNLGAAYGVRDGNNSDGRERADFVSFKLGINVPLFADRKQKQAISQRNSEVKQQQYALQDSWLTIQADITSTVADYERRQEQILLYDTGVLPQARLTVASMLSGYQVNKVDFLNLIRAQITLYNYETNLWQSISEAKSALAKLVALAGEENIHE